MKFKFIKTVVTGLFITMCNVAHAGIIEGTDVTIDGNIYNTYFDEGTSLTWLDIDSFRNTPSFTINSLSTYLNGTGFHIAFENELDVLLSAMPLSGGSEWVTYAAYTGAFTDIGRDLIWGVFDRVGEVTGGYAWSNNPDTIWRRGTTFGRDTVAQSSNLTENDLGFFVVSDNVLKEVPEPSTLAIFALGMIGLASRRFKK